MCSNAAIVICSFKEKDSKTAVGLIWKAVHKCVFEMKCLYVQFNGKHIPVPVYCACRKQKHEQKALERCTCVLGGTIFSKIYFCCEHSVPMRMLISVVCDNDVCRMLK